MSLFWFKWVKLLNLKINEEKYLYCFIVFFYEFFIYFKKLFYSGEVWEKLFLLSKLSDYY